MKYLSHQNTAFTLVELIVSITILSILGILSFINVRVYVADSRNTKIVNDLNSLSNSLRAHTTAGKNILGFVANTSSRIPSISLFGSTGSLTAEEYTAGDINYQAFGSTRESFLDPYKEKSYKIGILQAPGRNVFELAGTYMELDSGSQRAKIYGSYDSRDTTRQVSVLQINVDSAYIELNPQDVGFFKLGDTLTDGTQDYIIEEISKTSQTIYLNTVTGLTSGDTLSLKLPETLGLIGSAENISIPLYEGSPYLPY